MTTRRKLRDRPRLFIGSSTEGLEVARQLQAELDPDAEGTVWNQGVFKLGYGGLESLVREISTYEFAALILTPDDLTTKRDISKPTPRDNVLLELGPFIGALGRERTFMVYCSDDDLDLPSDMLGVTAATYRRRSDGLLRAALGPAATRIREAMQQVSQAQTDKVSASTSFQTWRPAAPVAWRLVPGCNNVVAVANETVQQVAARVAPTSAVISIWKQIPGTGVYQVAAFGGNVPAGVSNLATVNALDAIFICVNCVNAAAIYQLAGIFDTETAMVGTLSVHVAGTGPAPGAPGVRMFGAAQLDGQPAPAGTTVFAVVNGNECGSALVAGNGTYVIDVDSAATRDGWAQMEQRSSSTLATFGRTSQRPGDRALYSR